MKKIFVWVGGLLVSALVILGIVFITMTHVHKHSYKDEAIRWFPALEKVFDKDETSKDDDIVIEDETSDETQTDEGTSTEGTEQTEETQSE